MRKLWFSLMIAAAVLLSACGQAASPTPTTGSTGADLPTEDPSAVKMTCNVVSMLPTPEATEASLFPAPSDDDWVKGNQEAAVTFIEYSDYQ